jgi:hypothetical protein
MTDSFWSSNTASAIWRSRSDNWSDRARSRQMSSEKTERPVGRTGRAPRPLLVARGDSPTASPCSVAEDVHELAGPHLAQEIRDRGLLTG